MDEGPRVYKYQNSSWPIRCETNISQQVSPSLLTSQIQIQQSDASSLEMGKQTITLEELDITHHAICIGSSFIQSSDS